MSGDRLIRVSAAAVVTAVAAFAAVISYSHIYDLGRRYGQFGTAGRLLPLSVDGLILAASLVMLHEARNRRPAPALARCMLWLGIAATVAANVAYGARYGPVGAVISAWPAVAFVGAAEMIMGLVRRGRGALYVVDPAAPASGHLYPEAVETFAGELAEGQVPSIRAIRARLHIGQPKAREIRAHLAALAGTR
jgi:peptidoglycan/LPS O-acetylase OafA/YrhL